MSEELKKAVEDVIAHLSSEFIVEECIGNLTEGCLSCEMIETRSSLRKVLEILDESASWQAFAPTPHDREGEH